MTDYDKIRDSHLADRGSFEGNAKAAVEEYQNQHWNTEMTVEEIDKLAEVRKEWDKIGEAANILCSAVNGGNVKEVAKAFYMGFCKNHRTLQNQGIATLIEFLRIYKDTNYDLRNVVAVQAAAQIAQFADDQDMIFPLI